MPPLLNLISDDLNRYYKIASRKKNLSFLTRLEIILFSYGFHATAVYRFNNYLDSIDFPVLLLLFKYILNLFTLISIKAVTKLYGIHISPHASIEGGFYIGHFGGIFIGKCSIGKNCSIQQQVRIGEHPENATDGIKIGNDVWIGAHAKIMQNVIIEDKATVAAGSVVKQGMTIATRNLVMGNPARPIKLNYDNVFIL